MSLDRASSASSIVLCTRRMIGASVSSSAADDAAAEGDPLVHERGERHPPPVPDLSQPLGVGHAQVAECSYTTGTGRNRVTRRLIVRRTRLIETAQQRLWPDWRHHAFLTDLTIFLFSSTGSSEVPTAAGGTLWPVPPVRPPSAGPSVTPQYS